VTRFKQGDPVFVRPTGGSLFDGVHGVIQEVKPNPRNLTELDACIVVFAWGEKRAFWAAQLEPAPENAGSPKRSES
jgi:hypothetical protein